MSLDSKPAEATLRFQETMQGLLKINNGYHIKKVAADWLAKEIEFLTNKAMMAEGNAGYQEALSTLLNWILGDHVSRWHDPLMHKVLMKEVETRAEVQRFVSGRLPLLIMMISDLERPQRGQELALYNIVKRLHVFPESVNSYSNGTFPVALIESAFPNEDYLKELFREHHWLMVLLFAIAAFQFFGYDQALLDRSV